MLRAKYIMIRDTPITYRLGYQPLFGNGARVPPLTSLFSGRNVQPTREYGGNRAYLCCRWHSLITLLVLLSRKLILV